MNPVIATYNDTGSVQDLQTKAVSVENSTQRNATKTDNKATESVQSLKKSDTNQSITRDDKVVTDTNYQTQRLEKISDSKIAQEKVENRQLDQKAVEDTTKLEVKRTYTSDNSEDKERLTAAEVATKEKDALESVKSVKPDGTETYYFPVPIEVLTQLPPPGNIGLSEKMMEQIIQDNEEKAAENKDAQEIVVQSVEGDAQKIEISSNDNISEEEVSDIQEVQENASSDTENVIDYGFG